VSVAAAGGAPVLRWRPLIAGPAAGEILRLASPLSLWGGLDPKSGEIIDLRHPQSGHCVSGRILVMSAGRGSSSASSVLLEAVRLETAPAAILTVRDDGILALGAAVARELYRRSPTVGVIAEEALAQLETGRRVELLPDGTIQWLA
jgi:hypothetical protein